MNREKLDELRIKLALEHNESLRGGDYEHTRIRREYPITNKRKLALMPRHNKNIYLLSIIDHELYVADVKNDGESSIWKLVLILLDYIIDKYFSEKKNKFIVVFFHVKKHVRLIAQVFNFIKQVFKLLNPA